MAGGIVGHTICAAIAVIGGRSIASHISERTIAIIGEVLFILLAIGSKNTATDRNYTRATLNAI